MGRVSSFPVVDFSNLVSEGFDKRSNEIQQLLNACQEWGCFILVNHGIPDAVMDATLATVKEFFDLPDEEKKQYEGDLRNLTKRAVYLQSISTDLWWSVLRLLLHSDQSCLSDVPKLLREVVSQYSQMVRKLIRALVEAVVEGLELEKQYVSEVLELDTGFQVLGANLYPVCPEADRAIGLPEHTDASLFTTVIDGGVPGLQIEKDGQWVDVVRCSDQKTSLWVNVGDMLEVFSNGRFKSLKHRAVANKEKERISIAVANYPPMEVIVEPATALVQRDGEALYEATTYSKCLEAKYMQPKKN